MTDISNEIINSVETVQGQDTETPEVLIATVGEVTDDGITLIFPGEEEASEKKYTCNMDILFKAGDRVKIAKESGSYIVEYPIGSPMERYPIPTDGTTGYYLQKTSTGMAWAKVDEYEGPTINGSGTTSLGFFGTTAGIRQTLSTTSTNQGYTSATSSNYLVVLNNIAGILKKLGLLR